MGVDYFAKEHRDNLVQPTTYKMLSNAPPPFAVLKLLIDDTKTELVSQYREHVEKHNTKMMSSPFPDAGFDLLLPDQATFSQEEGIQTKYISMGCKAEMVYHGPDGRPEATAFDLYLRSSVSKTPLMLANHVGIIDSGYRGDVIGAFRNLSGQKYVVDKHVRLLQICHWSRCKILVELVGSLSDTARGMGGFGSTGGTTVQGTV